MRTSVQTRGGETRAGDDDGPDISRPAARPMRMVLTARLPSAVPLRPGSGPNPELGPLSAGAFGYCTRRPGPVCCLTGRVRVVLPTDSSLNLSADGRGIRPSPR